MLDPALRTIHEEQAPRFPLALELLFANELVIQRPRRLQHRVARAGTRQLIALITPTRETQQPREQLGIRPKPQLERRVAIEHRLERRPQNTRPSQRQRMTGTHIAAIPMRTSAANRSL